MPAWLTKMSALLGSTDEPGELLFIILVFVLDFYFGVLNQLKDLDRIFPQFEDNLGPVKRKGNKELWRFAELRWDRYFLLASFKKNLCVEYITARSAQSRVPFF